MTKVLAVYPDLEYAQAYADALRDVGLEPILIASNEDASLDGIQGLLLLGGSDVDPALYGEERGPDTGSPDKARDVLECKLIAEAIDRGLPVFGICRGLQMLNVQQGGTLTQHLPGFLRHRRVTEDRALPAHSVAITPGTLLASIAGYESTWEVNSRHHQGIATVAASLRISAVDPEDGTIEAIERPDKRFVLAVQWHPENQAPVNAKQRKLFEAFAEACHSSGSISTATSSL